jgi:hypothetical protein
MAGADVPADYLLVTTTNTRLSYVRTIGSGGGGEVYEVLIPAFRNTDLPLGF